jgi:hypothetical protein
MPKKPPQDKKSVLEKRSRSALRSTGTSSPNAAQSLGSIMKKQGWLRGLEREAGAQRQWLEWLGEALPAELRRQLVNVVQKGPELSVLTASAAWSARVRFALVGLEERIRARQPDIVKISVRVAPAGRTRATRADLP